MCIPAEGCVTGLLAAQRSLLFATEHRLLRVLRWKGPHGVWPAVLFKLDVMLPAANQTNEADVSSGIGFDCLDFHRVVWSDCPVPLQPQLPSVWHRVGKFDVDD